MTKQTTDAAGTTTEADNTLVLEEHVPAFMTVTIASPTGTETIDVPTEVAQDDDLLRSVLGGLGISAAATALIERDAETGTITLTKQPGQNG